MFGRKPSRETSFLGSHNTRASKLILHTACNVIIKDSCGHNGLTVCAPRNYLKDRFDIKWSHDGCFTLEETPASLRKLVDKGVADRPTIELYISQGARLNAVMEGSATLNSKIDLRDSTLSFGANETVTRQNLAKWHYARSEIQARGSLRMRVEGGHVVIVEGESLSDVKVFAEGPRVSVSLRAPAQLSLVSVSGGARVISWEGPKTDAVLFLDKGNFMGMNHNPSIPMIVNRYPRPSPAR